ncbi:hypothetical protein D020_0121B, partial [Vibrio parahaemolyticus SBR10290]
FAQLVGELGHLRQDR